MPILFSNEILSAIKDELRSAISSVQLITAYCKEQTFDNLSSCIGDAVSEKKLLVRFRKDDVIKGSTDFNVLQKAIDRGWQVYIRFDLHAKTYIVDNKRCFVGSANLTNAGMNVGSRGNMEMATLVDMEASDIEKIQGLYYDAISVDDSLITKMWNQLEDRDDTAINTSSVWDAEITSMFSPKVTTLFSHELPEMEQYNVGDMVQFLDVKFDGSKDHLKEELRWSNAYLWLVNILKEENGCMYFGALSERLHNALISDPKPYRRDVKQMLSNLLHMIESLGMEDVIIDRPNYSQRIRLRENVGQ